MSGVSSSQRFTADDPCPICGGHDRMPRGGNGRCVGFYNRDRSYANCTSEAFAGGLEAKGDPPSYGHRMNGPCRCGQTHGAATPAARVEQEEPEHFQESFFKRCPEPYPVDYRRSDGTIAYRVARWPLPDGRKTYSYYRPDGSGGWLKSLTDELKAQRVVLDLPEIRQEIAEGRSILLAEGEGKARMLRALGFAATASDGGAEGFKPQHAECLRGAKRVYIIVDHDTAGLKRGERVPPLLCAVGIPDIRVVLLPGLKWAEKKGEGVDDWIRQRQSHTPGRIRAELESFLKQPAPWTTPAPGSETSPETKDGTKPSPWDAAQDVHDFLSTVEKEGDWLVPHLIMKGAVTMWFSPRGLGKTLVAHWIAADLARRDKRVLLIDRDNPRRELRRRLRAWGLTEVERDRLKVICRDEAPPLTDASKWREFPVGAYDLVILDSFDSSSEGVGEQDSSKSSMAVAALLDVVRTTVGPAALILGNTIKSGAHGRGSGVIEDRLDIVYEVRDATGFRPSGSKDWWQELPESGRDAWADRASRRKRQDSYRLAFVPSKFRVGEEPDPFAFEVSCKVEPWTCSEVTADLVQEGAESRQQAEQARVALLEEAAGELAKLVKSTGGIEQNGEDGAVAFLKGEGLSRNAARDLIAQRAGTLWRLSGAGHKDDPKMLLPLESETTTAGKTPSPEPHKQRDSKSPIPAVQSVVGRQESASTKPAIDAVSKRPGFLPSTLVIPTPGEQHMGGWGVGWQPLPVVPHTPISMPARWAMVDGAAVCTGAADE